MRRALATLALVASAASCAAAPTFGINCSPGATQCGGTGAAQQNASVALMLAATRAGVYRLRIQAPHLIYDGATYGATGAAVTYVASDIDPLANPADTSHCGQAAYPMVVGSVAGFHIGDPIASDAIDPAGAPTVCAVVTGGGGPKTLYVTRPVTYYVSTNQFAGAIGSGGLANVVADPPCAGCVGVPLELTIFNPSNPGKPADGPLLDQTGSQANCASGAPGAAACDAMYQTRLAYLFAQVGAWGVVAHAAQGNEEDGGTSASCGNGASQSVTTLAALQAAQQACAVTLTLNGDWGDLGDTTMAAQIQKLRDLCIVAHGLGITCSDGGIEIIGLELTYADYLWNTCGTSACRRQADLFQQWGFGKSVGQDQFAQRLQTSCQAFVPPYLNTSHESHAQRALSLLMEEANAGQPRDVDYANFHYYDVPWQGMAPAFQWAAALTGKPLMADEAAVYTASIVDVERHLQGAALLGFRYFLWWNQAAGSATPLTGAYAYTSGDTPAAVPSLAAGRMWLGVLAGTAPDLITGTAPPQPFC